MFVGITTDSPSWTKVDEISAELNSLSTVVEKKYPFLEWELVVCLRCLPSDLERKSFCRYYSKENMLILDISMDEELFVPYKKNKNVQREIIGKYFFDFFKVSIEKYEKKIPRLRESSESLKSDVKQWCFDHKWLG
jgi:hypothetical protein